jgi:formylglycine-generating enzyme required for sulfatase activity
MAERETTVAEYIDFLRAVPAMLRAMRLPVNLGFASDGDGSPVLHVGKTILRPTDPYCRPKRALHRCQDWLHLPVEGIAWEDARAYADWLALTRLPGARLCSEREWERAARGADGRPFPQGDQLLAGDTNFQATYAVDAEQMGADEVGSFPVDRSPFGVLDLGGNVSEWVGDSVDGAHPETHVARGGNGFNAAFNARSYVRSALRGRTPGIGLRICIDAPSGRD